MLPGHVVLWLVSDDHRPSCLPGQTARVLGKQGTPRALGGGVLARLAATELSCLTSSHSCTGTELQLPATTCSCTRPAPCESSLSSLSSRSFHSPTPGQKPITGFCHTRNWRARSTQLPHPTAYQAIR